MQITQRFSVAHSKNVLIFLDTSRRKSRRVFCAGGSDFSHACLCAKRGICTACKQHAEQASSKVRNLTVNLEEILASEPVINPAISMLTISNVKPPYTSKPLSTLPILPGVTTPIEPVSHNGKKLRSILVSSTPVIACPDLIANPPYTDACPTPQESQSVQEP